MSKIVYLGHTYDAPISILFAVDGKRYEYEIPNSPMLEAILFIMRKASIGKAFAQAKRKGKLLEPIQ